MVAAAEDTTVEIGQDAASNLLGPALIPEVSYSSSEDEFFDTEEYLNSPKHAGSCVGSRGSLDRTFLNSSSATAVADDEGEPGSMQANGESHSCVK